ncbi:hypothetical protein [Pseudovibrio denitrificans]|uniref:hypothetical protein n=1 Tax=Pseudovibrio denitrificans TaxID=258256 RepID=UPI003570B74D
MATLGSLEPVFRNSILTSLLNHLRIMRIKEDLELLFVQILLILGGGSFFNLVCIVEYHTQIADAAHAGF